MSKSILQSCEIRLLCKIDLYGMSQQLGQHFSHRTEQHINAIYSITTSNELLTKVFNSNGFKVDDKQFYADILNAKCVTILDRNDDNQIIIKYEKYGLHAVAKRDENSKNNQDLILIHFLPKKEKKSNYPKTRSNNIPRSYIPMTNTETGINRVQGYIEVFRKITMEIIPNRIKETHIIDIYQFMDKMIYLQNNSIPNEKIWILYFNMHCKDTNEPLYCIALKITDPQNNRNFSWRLHAVLYTAKDIYNNWPTTTHLPTTMLTSDTHSLKMQQVIIIKRILSDPNKRNKIFSKKKSWQKVNIFINEKQKNKEEKKLGIRKEHFLQACHDAANMCDDIIIIPMLLFDEFDYSIDGLWRVRIHDGLDVAISFTLSSKKTTIIPTGIHVCVDKMMVHCQLINTQQQIGNFFDVWMSKFNNVAVGDPNSDTVRYNRKIKEIESLRDENAQQKAVIEQDEYVFKKLKLLNIPKVNQILELLETRETINDLHCDQKDKLAQNICGNHSSDWCNDDLKCNVDEKISETEKDTQICTNNVSSCSTLNPYAKPFDDRQKMVHKLNVVPENDEVNTI
eukprot:194956_1